MTLALILLVIYDTYLILKCVHLLRQIRDAE